MNPVSDSSPAPELVELLQAMRAHLEAGLRLAKQGLAAAERAQDHQLEQFFRSCVRELGRADGDASLLHAAAHGAAVGPAAAEQVSSASFASGDGLSDAEVIPEGARGEPGS